MIIKKLRKVSFKKLDVVYSVQFIERLSRMKIENDQLVLVIKFQINLGSRLLKNDQKLKKFKIFKKFSNKGKDENRVIVLRIRGIAQLRESFYCLGQF